MKVHCLGTTGYHPSPTRHTACYYIPESSLVLDAGTGMHALTEILRADPRESIDVFLSHAHLDHVVGLTFLLDTFAVTSLKRVRVLGEAEKLEAVRKHLFSPHLFPLLPKEIEFHSLEENPKPMQLGCGAELDWFSLEHPGGSIGLLLRRQGKSLAYVTDTVARLDADYVNRVVGVDLLLHECYFTDRYQPLAEKTGHSWLGAVTEVVRKVGAKRTALIHLNPLAEQLGEPMVLSSAHTKLGMCIPKDGDCLAF